VKLRAIRPLVHNGAVTSSATEPAGRPNGSTQRQHILNTALTLMSQQGVDGTSMRNLAAATGLNVASLYHYFPSKRDLLVAVLEERGLDPASQRPLLSEPASPRLADLLDEVLQSMLEVEDFIRLMLGEVMRGDQTAYAVGTDLFAATQELLEQWLAQREPTVDPPGGQEALARMLRTLLVGLLIEHVTGVLDPVAGGDGDAATKFRARAAEIAAIVEPVVGSTGGAS
jgi:AcrR family transcriptional regulator